MQLSPIPSFNDKMVAGVTKTTLYGNIGKYAGIAALIAGAVLPTLPADAQQHVAQAALALTALANAFNGQGNIQSVTGSSKD